jgi:hypothetical protein
MLYYGWFQGEWVAKDQIYLDGVVNPSYICIPL